MAVRIRQESVHVWVQGSDYIVIKRAEFGRMWSWEYGGKSGAYAIEDYEATAEAMAKFIVEEPSLATTAAWFRLGIEEAAVQRQAAGLTRQQIGKHAREARAAFAATTPRKRPEATASLRARARWMEWQRIEKLLDAMHLPVYDPARDPRTQSAAADR
jgi:hypothetical protein